ncbi:hypothetical protein SAY87_016170 [Trapa incisa]|uniref:Uncharacterized protein n=1 Tax=Trapa incisa TaxID=236973 RepID=A0AAN7QU72_9MYRT|nr:hypothetical protein SAY87_016170 [Trapa incisa]
MYVFDRMTPFWAQICEKLTAKCCLEHAASVAKTFLMSGLRGGRDQGAPTRACWDPANARYGY